MKQYRNIFLLFLLAVLLISCHSNSFKVNGIVENIEDGDTLLVKDAMANTLDTLVVQDSHFSWKGETDSVTICTIVAKKGVASAMFFNEPGTIDIILRGNGESEISGTKANDALQELNEKQLAFQKKAEALVARLYSQNPDEEQQKAIYEQYENLQKEMRGHLVEMANKNTDNELGFFLVSQLAYSEVFTNEELRNVIDKLSKEFRERKAIKEIEEMLASTFSTEVGETIQDFTMQNPDGQKVGIMDLVKQNQLTVLDFWASWCQPCREEMPIMKKILADNNQKGFGIVGISLDDDQEAWTNAINEIQLSWPQITDLQGGMSTIAQSFGVKTIPFTVIVDQNGKILAKGLRGEELASFVSEHLK